MPNIKKKKENKARPEIKMYWEQDDYISEQEKNKGYNGQDIVEYRRHKVSKKGYE